MQPKEILFAQEASVAEPETAKSDSTFLCCGHKGGGEAERFALQDIFRRR